MLEQEPNDSFLNYAMALEVARAGDSQQAIALIEGVITRDPDYLGSYLTIGKMYESTGQPEKAMAAYSNGIEVAKRLMNTKALGELNEALQGLD